MRFLLLILVFLNNPVIADTISMRADNWCPFNCDPKDKNPGYVIEILNAMAKKNGHVLDYQLLAWNKAVQETAEGKFTGVIGGLKDDLPGGISTEPIGKGETCLYGKSDSAFKFESIASLKGKKTAVIKDYNYGGEIDVDIKNNPGNYDIAYGDNPLILNMRKLDAGRVDLAIETSSVFEFTASKEGFSGKFKKIHCTSNDELFVLFSGKNPKSKEYVAQFNSAMDEIRKSGELKNILSKYGLQDWK